MGQRRTRGRKDKASGKRAERRVRQLTPPERLEPRELLATVAFHWSAAEQAPLPAETTPLAPALRGEATETTPLAPALRGEATETTPLAPALRGEATETTPLAPVLRRLSHF